MALKALLTAERDADRRKEIGRALAAIERCAQAARAPLAPMCYTMPRDE